ncbi:MAG: hypothetical protein VX944_14935 [Myxococcota bacterium]|nr:hypothetical protein [Myxococcota bacterium]MEC9391367.1 hypothetical protein [Myxococcota bacterium]
MSDQIKRVSVDGLRGADVATIQVLTQDVLGLPINQINPDTVCALFALAEVSDQVPEQLAADLAGFVGRAGRELADMAEFDSYVSLLLSVDGSAVPETFRAAVQAAQPESEAAAALAAHLEGAVAAPFEVSEGSSVASEAAAGRTKAAKPQKSAAAVKKQNDAERREWIGEFVLSRLQNYETGLKESLLVGAARHKAPWDDITDREVRSVLRAMGRDGKLRTTVGRWLINR